MVSVLKRIFNFRGNAKSGAGVRHAWTDSMFEELRLLYDKAEPIEGMDATDQLALIYATQLEQAPEGAERPCCVDFGRAMLALILDTHGAPPAQQLLPEELDAARLLLRAFFYGTEDVSRAAERLLSFIEERFSAHRYTQAAHLLELFDTEAETRRHNALNLFYESFQLRLRGKREEGLRRSRIADLAQVHRQSLEAKDLGMFADWLSEHAGIRLHISCVHRERTSAWHTSLAAHGEVRHGDTLERSLSGPAWRPVQGLTTEVAARMAGGTRGYTLRAHTGHLLRAVYFVSRVAGRTGFEYTLGAFTSWVEQVYETRGSRILPELHLHVLDHRDTLDDIVDDVLDRFMSQRREPAPLLNEARLTEALHSVHRSLGSLALEGLPAGDYNLAGLVYDHLVAFPFQRVEDALRVHRIL